MTRNFETVPVNLGYDDIAAVTGPGGRKYLCPNGEQYASITTVLGLRGKEFIKTWRERVGEAEANRISRAASSRGTSFHSVCDKYLSNEPLGKLMPDIADMFFRIKPVLDECIGKIYLREKPLFSSRVRVAGRVDLIAEWNGKLSVIDFKTSVRDKQHSEISSYFLQETFYATAFAERTGIHVPQIVTLIVCDDVKQPKIFIEDPAQWVTPLINEIKYYRKNADLS